MNLVNVIQKEIARSYPKPRGVSVVPKSNHLARIDGGGKPDRQLATEFTWMVQSYTYDRGGSYVPVVDDFINRMYPAPQESNDGFNSIQCWSVGSRNGRIRDKQLAQYTNRRYSTYIITEGDMGMEPVKITIQWDKDWRVLHTTPEGIEISYTSTSNTTMEYTTSIPISPGCNRIDILLYTDDDNASELSVYIDITDTYNNALPIPMMRMATIDNIILDSGDDNWHDYMSAITYTPVSNTISFQDNAESTTVNFVDNSLVPGADTIVRTGAWSEFSNGVTISVSGSVSNDGIYTIDTVVGDTITLVAGDKLQDESGVAVTIRTTAEITDSASGMGDFSTGDIIRVSGTTSNNNTFVITNAAADKLILSIFNTVTDEATVQATLMTKGKTHHGADEGVNFRVRDVMLIPKVLDVLPNDLLTYASTGHEHQTLNLELADPSLTGDSDAGTSHSHGSTALSISGTTSVGTSHGHSISSDGDPAHDHTGSTGSESSHTHTEGSLDVGGTTDTEFAHTHGITSPTAEITDPIIIGGVKTSKDTILIPGSQVVDETDPEVVQVEVMRDGNGFILPAVRGYISKSLVFNSISYTNTGIEYKDVVNEASTISFNDNSPGNDTITDSATGFGDFVNGMEITIMGSLYNDGTYTVQTAAAGTLTLAGIGVLTDEATGYSCIIHGESYIKKVGANFDTQGFATDTLCRISDTIENNGDFSIKSVTADQINLYSFEILTDETVAGNSTVKGQGTIVDSTNTLLSSGFTNEMTVSISGAANPENNNLHYIEKCTASKVTLSIDDILVDETVSATIQSVDIEGFRVRYKIATGRKLRIHYVCLAYGYSVDLPASPSYP